MTHPRRCVFGDTPHTVWQPGQAPVVRPVDLGVQEIVRHAFDRGHLPFFYFADFLIDAAPEVIKSVALKGTNLQVNLTTQVGHTYNAGSIERDVRDLWSTGRFDDIRVETMQDADGIAAV